MKDIRAKYLATSLPCSASPAFAIPMPAPHRVIALEHAIAEKQICSPTAKTSTRPTISGPPSDFAAKAPGLDWAEFFRAAGLQQQTQLHRLAALRLHRRSRSRRLPAPRCLERLLAYHLSRPTPASSPTPSPTNASPSSARSSPEPRSSDRAASRRHPRQRRPGRRRRPDLRAEATSPPEAKAQAQAMVANLIAAFRKRLEALTWMAPATKAEAQAKLDTLYVGIGYPDTWRDYAALRDQARRPLRQSLARQPLRIPLRNSRASANPSTATSGA